MDSLFPYEQINQTIAPQSSQIIMRDGYTMIAQGDWNALISGYGFNIIIALILGYAFSRLFRGFVDKYFRDLKAEKQQTKIAQQLPGIYK